MPIRLTIWYFEEVNTQAEIRKNPFELEVPNLNLTGYELKQRLSKITKTPEENILLSTMDKLVIDGELKLKNYQLENRSILLMRKKEGNSMKIAKNLGFVFVCGVVFGVGYYGSCYVIKNYLGSLKDVPGLFKK